MRILLLLFVGLVGLVALGWFVRSARTPTPFVEPNSLRSFELARSADLGTDAEPSAAPAGPNEPVRDAVVPGETSQAQRSPAESGVGPAIDLWIVEPDGSTPAAHAIVRCGPEPAPPLEHAGPGVRMLRAVESPTDGWDEIERSAARYEADGNGRVRLPSSPRAALAIARLGEHFGIVRLAAQATGYRRLQLNLDTHWKIRVVDRAARPIAGLPLAVRRELEARDGFEDWFALETDATGEARIEHAGWWLADTPAAAFELEPVALLRESHTVRVAAGTPPPALTELVLPELGLAEVTLRDAAGRTWTDDGSHGSARVGLRNGELADSNAPSKQAGTVRLPFDAAGRYRRHVEVGMPLEASWQLPSSSEFIQARHAGARSAGEVVRIDLVVGSTHPLLRVRLVDPSGAPFASQPIRMWCARTGAVRTQQDSRPEIRTTNAQGELELAWTSLEPTTGVELVFQSRDEIPQEGALLLPSTLGIGRVDLGDLVLVPAAILAAGVVVGADGTPLMFAHVTIETRAQLPAPLNGIETSESTAPAGPGAANSAALPHWTPVDLAELAWSRGPKFETYADETGRFLVHSGASVERVRARAKAKEHAPGTWIELAENQRTQFILELTAASTLVGRVLLPEGDSASHVDLRLIRVEVGDAAGRPGRSMSLEPNELGYWRSGEIGAGSWIVQAIDHSDPFDPVQGGFEIDVGPGVTLRAPDLDLRGVLKIALRLRLRDLAVLPAPPFQLGVRVASDSAARSRWLLGYRPPPLAVFDATGATVLQVRAAGARHVAVCLTQPQLRGSTAECLAQLESLHEIHVPDGVAEASFELDVDPASVAAALSVWSAAAASDNASK
jgi:hypothetical protein